jgi:tetratricopeptide (TPR) repeat protein
MVANMDPEYISPGKKIFITGHELRLQGNFELAIELLLDILSSPIQDPILRVDTLNELVICNRALHIYDNALNFSLEALKVAEDNNYRSGMANSLLNLGALAHLSYSLKEAKDFFRRALNIFESELNDTLGVAKVLIHIGLVSRDEGMIEKAEGNLYTSYKLIEKNYADSEYRYVLIRALNHLGNTKLLELNFLDGIKLFKESLALSENTKDVGKKPLILRNLALCYLILDLKNDFLALIAESIQISTVRKQTYEIYLSKMYELVFYYQNRNYDSTDNLLDDLEQLSSVKQINNNFFVFFITGLIKNELNSITIKETLTGMEDYFRGNNYKIKNELNLILLEIETIRVLTDQITAQHGGFTFGLMRKFEKLIRVARGHKEERIYLILYTYLLDLMIPRIKKDDKIRDENNESIVKLLKQIRNDISSQLFIQLFIVLEVLITIFYTMDFSESISKLLKVKNYFSQIKMTEIEVIIFRLENDLSEKLAKLTEVTELNNIENIKKTVTGFQNDLRIQITEILRYFRFKVLQVLFLLKDIAI